jgi:hypothetical protein
MVCNIFVASEKRPACKQYVCNMVCCISAHPGITFLVTGGEGGNPSGSLSTSALRSQGPQGTVLGLLGEGQGERPYRVWGESVKTNRRGTSGFIRPPQTQRRPMRPCPFIWLIYRLQTRQRIFPFHLTARGISLM